MLNLTPEQQLALKLKLVREQLSVRQKLLNPTTYGLPALHFPPLRDESMADFRIRRENAIVDVVENHLRFKKDDEVRKIVLIPEQVRLLTDLTYGYVSKAIMWKSRGGGGSLMAAVVIWLNMVYNNRSFIDMAGSGDQARQVYEYTKQFWASAPGLAEQFLASPPLMSATVTNAGSRLQCVACSQTAVRGKHESGFIADESCQENDQGGDVFRAAMQGPMSEDDHLILLLSTFHHPFGFFAEHWDKAEELGFTRYKWDIYDTMLACKESCDCLTECPLTRVEETRDYGGRKTGEHMVGCCGKARNNAKGYTTRKRVLEIMKMNQGTEVFSIEYECNRPGGARTVFPEAAVNAALTREVVIPPAPPKDQPLLRACRDQGIPFIPPRRAVVGIDWGFTGQLAMVLLLRCDAYLAILAVRYFTGVLTDEVLRQIKMWEDALGCVPVVYADSSHPFNNAELANNGYAVTPVPFNTYKELGYQNLQKYFAHSKIKIMAEGTQIMGIPSGAIGEFKRQLVNLRKNAAGTIVKQDDHGPDAVMCATLNFPILSEFPEVVAVDEEASKRRGKAAKCCMLLGGGSATTEPENRSSRWSRSLSS